MSRSICVIDGCERLVNGHGYCVTHYTRWAKYGDPMAGVQNHAPPNERFMRKVRKDVSGCWIWEGARHNKTGYGSFQPGGRGSPTTGAHRYSYEMHKGPAPKGLHVMHSCDNRRCVNPDHLSLGTPKNNTDDMLAKGRWHGGVSIGEASGAAKLTEALVREMRASPDTHADWARCLGLGPNTIRAARTGRRWAHLNETSPPVPDKGKGRWREGY